LECLELLSSLRAKWFVTFVDDNTEMTGHYMFEEFHYCVYIYWKYCLFQDILTKEIVNNDIK
jgi:hypothetical protein